MIFFFSLTRNAVHTVPVVGFCQFCNQIVKMFFKISANFARMTKKSIRSVRRDRLRRVSEDIPTREQIMLPCCISILRAQLS